MDKKVDLIRVTTGIGGTLGVMTIDKVLFCNTLEPPKLNNEKYISCIPAGVRICRKWNSPIFGDTYLVCEVPGRTDIEFHTGNKAKDTKGCILLGKYSYAHYLKDMPLLTLSGITFHNFMEIMGDDQNFLLTIKEAF
jgi:hypothetical protein